MNATLINPGACYHRCYEGDQYVSEHMENIDSRKEQFEQKIEYKCPSYWWWAMVLVSLFILIIISQIYFDPDIPLAFQIFFSLWIILFFIMVLRSPRRIEIEGDSIKIKWLLGKTNLIKNDIKKIVKWKAPNSYFVFWIIHKKPYSLWKGTNIFPIIVGWTQKPYYNLEPSKVYDIVEMIEAWINNNEE